MDGTAGLILCGGRSSRMGQEKARLRFGPRTLLEIAIERMGRVAGPVAVSLASEETGTSRPDLPNRVLVARDGEPERGPLQGLLEGFRLLQGRAERVIVVPVDMPFFTEPWLRRLEDGLEDYAACLYRWEGFANALTAAYRLDLLPKLERLVSEGRMRPMFIPEGEKTREILVECLWREGEGPPPMMDMDTPEAYREALLLGGFGNPAGQPVTVFLPPTGAAGRGSAAPLEPISIPLQAATAQEAADLILRLYPEWGEAGRRDRTDGSAAGGSDGLIALHREDSPEPLRPDQPLAPDDRLWLRLRLKTLPPRGGEVSPRGGEVPPRRGEN